MPNTPPPHAASAVDSPAITGIAVAAAVVVILLLYFICKCCCKRRQSVTLTAADGTLDLPKAQPRDNSSAERGIDERQSSYAIHRERTLAQPKTIYHGDVRVSFA